MRSRKKRSYTRLIVLSLVIVIGIGVFVWSGNNKDEEEKQDTMEEPHVTNVLILGVDTRVGDGGRSDTMMIASIDTQKDTACLISVPRDTRVELKKDEYDKINHAFAYGGLKLSKSVAEKLLGIHINRYIVIDTKNFVKSIDLIGGVDIDVEKRMYYEDPWDDNGGLLIDLYPGEQHMQGDNAIGYVRYRDGEGDIGRIRRQQKFMGAVLNALITGENLSKLPQIAQELGGAVTTDMSTAELISFAQKLQAINMHGLVTQTVPGRPAYLEDVSYWIPDILELRHMMAKALGTPLTPDLEASAKIAAENYEKNLPKGLEFSGEKENKVASLNTEDKEKSKEGENTSNNVTKDTAQKAKDKEESSAVETDKKEKQAKETEPPKREDISVMVINCSGINGAGARAADVLRKKGFKISGVETGDVDDKEKTSIATAKESIDLFYGMPFPCVIMDGEEGKNATLVIGRDFTLDE